MSDGYNFNELPPDVQDELVDKWRRHRLMQIGQEIENYLWDGLEHKLESLGVNMSATHSLEISYDIHNPRIRDGFSFYGRLAMDGHRIQITGETLKPHTNVEIKVQLSGKFVGIDTLEKMVEGRIEPPEEETEPAALLTKMAALEKIHDKYEEICWQLRDEALEFVEERTNRAAIENELDTYKFNKDGAIVSTS